MWTSLVSSEIVAIQSDVAEDFSQSFTSPRIGAPRARISSSAALDSREYGDDSDDDNLVEAGVMLNKLY